MKRSLLLILLLIVGLYTIFGGTFDEIKNEIERSNSYFEEANSMLKEANSFLEGISDKVDEANSLISEIEVCECASFAASVPVNDL